MKHLLVTLSLIILLLGACEDKCIETYSYIEYTPIYAAKEEVLKAEVLSARPMDNPERLYFKDDYVFIVEASEGIHVINNSDPSSPIAELFISIPGNHDVAILDQFLYADNYTDLLVFDVSDIQNISQVSRIESVFEYVGNEYIIDHQNSSQLITGYDQTVVEREQAFDCSGTADDVVFFDIAALEGGISSSGSGVGGSTSRFTINNGFLYAVDLYSLRPFDLAMPSVPDSKEPTYLGWDIETVFPYEDQLFIGSRSGMHIYDVSVPETPEFLSLFAHANACDPVVVKDDIAFVTLRNGTECETFTNQLEIIDVSDLTNPRFIKSYPMDNPHGLGVRDNCLYICEGDFGLKFFDIEDLNDIQLKKHYPNIHALDVIPLVDNLLLIGNDGFHQYSGLCQDEVHFLSTLSF